MAKLDELLENPNLSERTRANLDAARNGLSDHLKPEDLTGALRDNLEIPVRKAGSGRIYAHENEVGAAYRALEDARDSLVYEFQRAAWRGSIDPELSSFADDLLAFHNSAIAFATP